MFSLTRPLTQFFASVTRASSVSKVAPFHSLTCAGAPSETLTHRVGGLFSISIRNNIRVHFPRPNEVKRVRRHGWQKRMSDAAGRKILMRRILKGRHTYSH